MVTTTLTAEHARIVRAMQTGARLEHRFPAGRASHWLLTHPDGRTEIPGARLVDQLRRRGVITRASRDDAPGMRAYRLAKGGAR